jgi:streptogramin lyase
MAWDINAVWLGLTSALRFGKQTGLGRQAVRVVAGRNWRRSLTVAGSGFWWLRRLAGFVVVVLVLCGGVSLGATSVKTRGAAGGARAGHAVQGDASDRSIRVPCAGGLAACSSGAPTFPAPSSTSSRGSGPVWLRSVFGRALSGMSGTAAPRSQAPTIDEFAIPTADNGPDGIAAGPDGNIWFTESPAGKIGRITRTGQITGEYTIPTADSEPDGIAAGPDGNMWFTEAHAGKIGRITPTGQITGEYTIHIAFVQPDGIAAGPDGNMWFTDLGTGAIGRIKPTGQITDSADGPPYEPVGIAPGPDGNLWFTDQGGGAIGRITPAGQITEYTVTTTGSSSPTPTYIAAGPDGNMWFTDPATNAIGRVSGIQLPPPRWRELGPRPILGTASFPLNASGRVTAIVVDPSNAKHLWLGGLGGVWRSFDGGTSWTPA